MAYPDSILSLSPLQADGEADVSQGHGGIINRRMKKNIRYRAREMSQ